MKMLLTILIFAASCQIAGSIPFGFMKGSGEGTEAYTYYSAVFDGTTRIERGAALDGLSDGKEGTLSFWMKMDTGSSDVVEYQICRATSGFFNVLRPNDSSVWIRGYNASATLILDIRSSASSVNKAAGWVHVIASWDLANTTTHLYIDGASDKDREVTGPTNDTLDYTRNDWAWGATEAGQADIPALFCEVAFWDEYIDLSNSDNRDYFRTAGGKPENIGSDGSTPPGLGAALFYFADEEPNWHTNKGTGGAFTEQGGTLSDGGSDKP